MWILPAHNAGAAAERIRSAWFPRRDGDLAARCAVEFEIAQILLLISPAPPCADVRAHRPRPSLFGQSRPGPLNRLTPRHQLHTRGILVSAFRV